MTDKLVDYYVGVQINFQITRPEMEKEEFIKAIWKELPANNVGDNLFVRFPSGAHDYSLNIDAAPKAEKVPGAIDVPATVVTEDIPVAPTA